MKILIRHSFEIEEEWEDKYATKEYIEFYYNEGTSCADNILKKINDIILDPNSHYSCACPFQSSEVIKIYNNAK